MTVKRAGTIALSIALVGAIGFLGWRWWRESSLESVDERVPRALSAGTMAAMSVAETILEPYRCGRLLEAPEAAAETIYIGAGTNRREARLEDQVLRLAVAPGRPVHIAVVADARGTTQDLTAIRSQLEALPKARSIDLVVSLGGMARDRQSIQDALAILTGPWFLVALPGDWEPYGDHLQAVTALADRGVIDGARARLVQLADTALLATLPGVAHAGRSLAHVDACVSLDEDIAALPELFARVPPATAAKPIPRVLLSHAPPRQSGPAATDASPAGVHIGERAIADALREARVALAIHGLLVPGAPASSERRAALDPAQPKVLSAGAADGIADIAGDGKKPPLALVITLAPGSVTWTYLARDPS